MLDKKRFYRIFIEIVLCQVALAVIMGTHKPSFFVDEIWTYNLSNAYYFPAFDNVEGYFYTWLKPEFWNTLITVSPEHRFSYDSVWNSQAVDVLPPFFYAIVHTVSSFFPEKFNIWFVLGPNLFFFMGAQALIVAISRKLFQQSWLALVPVIAYGFTLGGLNTILYFRMYMMVTFFAILALYLHLQLWDKLQVKDWALDKKTMVTIGLAFICGFLTHYYFLIFATFLTVPFIWYLNHKEAYAQGLKYLGTCLGALAMSIAIFPASFLHITGVGAKSGYRGAQSMNNAFSSEFLQRLGEYNTLLLKDIGGDILLLLLIIVGIWSLNRARKQFLDISLQNMEGRKKLSFTFSKLSASYALEVSNIDLYIAYIMFIAVCYYTVIVKISVMSDDRYIMPVIPLIIITGFYWFNRLVTFLSGKKYMATAMCIVVVWLAAMSSFRIYNLKFADMEIAPAMKTVEEKHPDIPMIVINQIPHWHPIIEHIPLLEKVPQAFLTTENEIDKVKPALEKINFSGEKLLVFVTWECKRPRKELQDELKRDTGLQHINELYAGGKYKRGNLYLLTK